MTTSFKRFNPWPIGVFLAFALFIPATFGLAIFTTFHKSDLVSPDYYEQEIRYQERFDRLKRTKPLLDSIRIDYDPAAASIRIQLPAEHGREAATGMVRLYRPSAAGLDRELALKLDANGAQRVNAGGLRTGLWKVRVEWRSGEQDFFREESIVVPSSSSARRQPPAVP
jgi:nitrogen fixation protein FixH